jgi:hypothetical protein
LRRECARDPRGTQAYRAISDMRYARESFIAAEREELPFVIEELAIPFFSICG